MVANRVFLASLGFLVLVQLLITASRVCLLVTLGQLGSIGPDHDHEEKVSDIMWTCDGHRYQGGLGVGAKKGKT